MRDISKAQEISGYVQGALLDLEGGIFDGDLDELYMLDYLLDLNTEMYEAIKAALRIPELWCPVGDPTSENEGEYQALSIMFNNFNEAIIAAEGKD